LFELPYDIVAYCTKSSSENWFSIEVVCTVENKFVILSSLHAKLVTEPVYIFADTHEEVPRPAQGLAQNFQELLLIVANREKWNRQRLEVAATPYVHMKIDDAAFKKQEPTLRHK
jgi:hypothetical protein